MQPVYGTIVLRPHWSEDIFQNLMVLYASGILCLLSEMMTPPFSYIIGIASLLLLIALLCKFIKLQCKRYRITGEQLIYSHGIFTRRHEYIELYRIIDFQEHQSLTQQLTRLKTVVVYSCDRTTPRLSLVGIRASLPLVAIIRERVEHAKLHRSIYEITNR